MRTPGLNATWSGGRVVSPGSPADATRSSSQLQHLGVVHRPRLVVVGDIEGAAPPVHVQSPAGTEEVVELGALPLRPGADRQVAGSRLAGATHARGIPVLVAVDAVAHPRPAVGQPEGESRADHHGRAVGVEAEEDDAAAPGVVDRVEPHVGLQEGPEMGDAGTAADPCADHAERDEADVGDSVEGVGADAGWHEVRDGFGLHRPVQERQVAPALAHHREPGQPRRLRRDWLDARVAHSLTLGGPCLTAPQGVGTLTFELGRGPRAVR